MVSVKPIRTEDDCEAALVRIDELMDALSGPGGQVDDPDHPVRMELEVLVDLVERFEARHYPVGPSEPIAAIRFQMDQSGLSPRDLIPLIGSRAKVSEVLAGKRAITMPMARALHEHLGIPADILLKESAPSTDTAFPDIDPTKFPLREMVKRGWIRGVLNLRDNADQLITELIQAAGGTSPAASALYRKNDSIRINAKTDEYALTAWCWHVLALARGRETMPHYRTGTVTPDFLRSVAKLSPSEDGPVRARDYLAEHGIALETEKHLPRTHLDGAALLLTNGRPVIGMTLRYDRIDNFWFTLLHELAHVGLHLDGSNGDISYVDDLSLRTLEAGAGDTTERDADRWAEGALIPDEIWQPYAASDHLSPMMVLDVAWEAGVHPAIVAGRVRHQTGNYRLLTQFVGTGEVSRHFEEKT